MLVASHGVSGLRLGLAPGKVVAVCLRAVEFGAHVAFGPQLAARQAEVDEVFGGNYQVYTCVV